MMRRAAVTAIVLLTLVPLSSHASEPPQWDEPVQIGEEVHTSWFPDIDVDQTGKVRLVWDASLDESKPNENVTMGGNVMFSEEGETGWSTPADIFVMERGIASRPLVASDGAWVHVLFRYAAFGQPVRMAYARAPISADLHNTHSWSEPLKISSEESYWAQLHVLANGDLIAVYNQLTPVEIDGEQERRPALFSRRSTDDGETWSLPLRISTNTDRVARTDLAVSPDGTHLLAVWDVGYDNLTATGDPSGLATSVSTDGGQSWSEPWTFSGAYEQSVVATNGERALLVYRSTTDDRLFFHDSDDGGLTWSEQDTIAGARARPYANKHNFDKLSMAVDGDGRFLLTWVGTDETSPAGVSVMVATLAGRAWTPPVVIAQPVGFPEYPRIAVALGNRVRVAYFVRDRAFDVGQYTIWIVNGTSDAQAIEPIAVTPAVIPTVAPRVIPAPELYVGPTPPSAPEPVEDAVVVNQTPQSINAQPMWTIVLTTTAGVVVLLLVTGAARRALRI